MTSGGCGFKLSRRCNHVHRLLYGFISLSNGLTVDSFRRALLTLPLNRLGCCPGFGERPSGGAATPDGKSALELIQNHCRTEGCYVRGRTLSGAVRGCAPCRRGSPRAHRSSAKSPPAGQTTIPNLRANFSMGRKALCFNHCQAYHRLVSCLIMTEVSGAASRPKCFCR